jgi:hypothetical protein
MMESRRCHFSSPYQDGAIPPIHIFTLTQLIQPFCLQPMIGPSPVEVLEKGEVVLG